MNEDTINALRRMAMQAEQSAKASADYALGLEREAAQARVDAERSRAYAVDIRLILGMFPQ